MKITRLYKNISKTGQELFDNYLPSKLEQIESLFKHLPDDAVNLDVKIEKYEKHDAYDVEFVLKMPMKTMKAKEASHSITKAVDLAKDRLVIQLKKFKDQMKKDPMNSRKHSSIRKPEIHEKILKKEEIKV